MNCKRMERLMREVDARGTYRRRGRKQAVSGPAAKDGLVHRSFGGDGPCLVVTGRVVVRKPAA